MATEIYKIENIKTIDGKNIEIIPLKIKYMREFMDVFSQIKPGLAEEEMIDILCDCIRVTMKQYAPEYSNHLNDILDNFDLKTIFDLLDFSAGIKMNRTTEDKINKDRPNQDDGNNSWEDLDLAKLETEVFLLGIWKSYDDLETSISMTELFSIISTRRELDYQEKRFLAGIQGIKLDGDDAVDEGNKKWEDMKARVFSRGAATDSKDILSLQGYNAQKAGFGIGMGLDYEKIEN
jgi:hypothetical protein